MNKSSSCQTGIHSPATLVRLPMDVGMATIAGSRTATLEPPRPEDFELADRPESAAIPTLGGKAGGTGAVGHQVTLRDGS